MKDKIKIALSLIIIMLVSVVVVTKAYVTYSMHGFGGLLLSILFIYLLYGLMYWLLDDFNPIPRIALRFPKNKKRYLGIVIHSSGFNEIKLEDGKELKSQLFNTTTQIFIGKWSMIIYFYL